MPLQGLTKRLRPGLVNFVAAVAYHSCLSLPAAITQPGQRLLANPCIFYFGDEKFEFPPGS